MAVTAPNIKKLTTTSSEGKPDMSFRHPESAKTMRWLIGRTENSTASKNNASLIDGYISFWVNPSECQWKIGTRTTIEKLANGIVHHEWPQKRVKSNTSFENSVLDQPTLSLTFQSGLITNGGYSDLLTVTPSGLGNFFDFIQILDEPEVTSTGAPNFVNIFYVSPLFGPRGLWLNGYFTEEGVSWTDSAAENPNQINAWGASFVVFNSSTKFSELKSNFQTLGIS